MFDWFQYLFKHFSKDLDKEESSELIRVSVEEILELQQTEIEAKQHKERIRLKALQERGFSLPLEATTDDY